MDESSDIIPLRRRGGPKLELKVTRRQVLIFGIFSVGFPLALGLPFAIEGIILTHNNVKCDIIYLRYWLLTSGLVLIALGLSSVFDLRSQLELPSPTLLDDRLKHSMKTPFDFVRMGLSSLLTLAYLVWFSLGNWWFYSSHECDPRLHSWAFALLVLHYILAAVLCLGGVAFLGLLLIFQERIKEILMNCWNGPNSPSEGFSSRDRNSPDSIIFTDDDDD